MSHGVHVYTDGVAAWTDWVSDSPQVRWTRRDGTLLASMPLPTGGLYPHGQIVNGDHWLVMQGHAGGTVLVKRQEGATEITDGIAGVFPLWLMPADGSIRRAPAGAGSQGFLWVDDDGREHYSDLERASIVAPANPTKGRPSQVYLYEPFAPSGWDWIIGQDITPNVERIIAYRRSTDDLFVVAEPWLSPVRPRGAQMADGSFLAALSNPGRVVPSSEFTAWTLPPPPPIVVVPPDPEPEPEPEPEPPPVIIVVPPPTPEPEPEPPPPTRRPWWRILLDYLLGGI